MIATKTTIIIIIIIIKSKNECGMARGPNHRAKRMSLDKEPDW